MRFVGLLVRINVHLRTLQITGGHRGIGKKSPQAAEEELSLDNTSLLSHRSLLLESLLTYGSVLAIIFSESQSLSRRCCPHRFIHS